MSSARRKAGKKTCLCSQTCCEICDQTNPKYKCPRCSIRTCSLHCVKRHKSVKGCSGVRDKTAYVPIKEFTDRHLLNDYRFLEDVDRKAYSAITDDAASQHQFRVKFHQLRNWCKFRKTWLKLLPPTFSRHKENTSWINRKEKVIYWRVHWIFPQSDAEYVDKSICEDRTLYDVLSTHLGPVKGDPVHRQRLKAYCRQGLDELRLYMKVEGRPSNSVRYHKLDLHSTLRENLSHKSLIEFPTIHVVLKESVDSYETAGQDQNTSLSQSSMVATAASETTEHLDNEGAAAFVDGDTIEAHCSGEGEGSGKAPERVHAGKESDTPLNAGDEDSGKDLEFPPDIELPLGKEIA